MSLAEEPAQFSVKHNPKQRGDSSLRGPLLPHCLMNFPFPTLTLWQRRERRDGCSSKSGASLGLTDKSPQRIKLERQELSLAIEMIAQHGSPFRHPGD